MRLGVGARRQRLIFQCPHCGVVLRGLLDPDPKTLELNWSSEDVEDCGYPNDLDESAVISVTVYGDLPVPRSLQGIPANEAVASPFIMLTQLAGERARDFMGSVEILRATRERIFPGVRRASSAYVRGDWDAVSDALTAVPLPLDADVQQWHPVYQFGRCVDVLYLPFARTPPREAAVGELMDLLMSTEKSQPEPYRELLETILGHPSWLEHRRRVVDTAMAALEAVDALSPALAWEVMGQRDEEVDAFQVMRDDFDQLKAIYQDIFELASRTLIYLGAVLNLAHRGDPELYVLRDRQGNRQEKHRSLIQALDKTTSFEREAILEELPHAGILFGAIDRHMRNAIGHRLISYDFATQTLIDDAGERRNYLLFLEDYLQSVRLTNYLMAVTEKLTLEQVQGATPQRALEGLPTTAH